MIVAYVCTDPGIPVFGSKGASIHAQSVLRVLLDQGHEVHLLTVRPGGDPMPGVVLHPLTPVRTGEAAAREQSAQRSDAEVADVLDRLTPDLVYERYSLWGRTATRWARVHGVPSVLEVNAPLVEEQAAYRELADHAGAQAVAVSALTSASTVVCVSAGVREWAQATSNRKTGIHLLANGVDTERITPAVRPVTAPDAEFFTVGFLGTLKAWHGIETLIQAVRLLSESDPTWRLLLVGDGPMKESLEKVATDVGIADRVELTGAVAADRVAAELHRMDIGCAPYPAHEHFYFSPLKVYEYLAAGLPIVASAIGQVPEALGHGSCGRLVAPGDAEALAAALRQVRADVAWRRTMRTEARRVAVEQHTWAAVVDHALTLVQRAAA